MSWLAAVPYVLCCAATFLVPGLLVSYLAGLRGVVAWGTAPLVTVAVVTGVAIVAGILGVPFGPAAVAVGLAVASAFAVALSVGLRLRGVRRPPAAGPRYHLAVVSGAVAAVVIGCATFVIGVGKADAVSQTWDAVFHYSAIRYILESGDASSLSLGSLNQPGTSGAFYPAAWHDMAALLAQLSGAGVALAALVTCLVISVLVWPLGCLLLARQLFGCRGTQATAAVVVTGFVSSLFGPFPWKIMGWGVLWPNALGIALAPGGVALGLSVLRLAARDGFGVGRRWFFAVAAAWAVAIAHPNSAISVAVILLAPLLIAFRRYLHAEYVGRHRVRGSVVGGAVVVVVVGAAVYVTNLPAVNQVQSYRWAPFDTVPMAIGEAFTGGTNGQHGALLLSVFLLIGVAVCFARRAHRWLVVAEVLVAALYVGSAAIGSPLAREFTGYWYDDSHRIAATLPIVAIPLTVVGLLATGRWLYRGVLSRPGPLALGGHRWAARTTLGVAAVVAGVSAVHGIPNNASVLGREFSTSGDHHLVGPRKRQFFRTVADIVPPGALVANDPFDGTAALWSFAGVHVTFPQAGPLSSSTKMRYLGKHLVDIATDSRACSITREYDIDFMITAPNNYNAGSSQARLYRGITDPDGKKGFHLAAAAGRNRLYKITMCQAGEVEAVPEPASTRGERQ